MRYIEEIEHKSFCTEESKRILAKFVRGMGGLRPKTTAFNSYIVMQASESMKKPLEAWTAADIDGYVKRELERGLSIRSVNNYKMVLKAFLNKTERPELAKTIMLMNPKKLRKLPKKIINREQLGAMLKACTNSRNRALIYFLYESACRRGEAMNMKIGDLEFDEYGAIVVVDGKTGERRIRIVESVPDLKTWLNDHPQKGKSDAPLWVGLANNKYCQKMHEMSCQDIVGVIGERAGLPFHMHPHMFRHARLTELASVMTEYQLRVYAGWTISSDMADIYVRRSGIDTESVILEAAGLRKPKSRMDIAKTLCQTCGKPQSPSAAFCYSCGSVLATDAGNAIKMSEPTGMRKEMDEMRKDMARLIEAVETDRKGEIIKKG